MKNRYLAVWLEPAGRYRLSVLSRILAAGAGGYLLSALVTAFLSLALPMAPADAVLTATMLSFLVYTAVVLWVFATTSARRAWLGVFLSALPLAGGILLLA